MSEDRTLATARTADEPVGEEPTKEVLQRRMEHARETITQTVTEIKDTVANQYQSVKETIHDTLDWREQFRKRPVAWSVGALSVGFLTGYCIAASAKGSSGSSSGGRKRKGYPSAEETDVWNVGASSEAGYEGSRAAGSPSRSYAAQAITGGSYSLSEYDEAQPDQDKLSTTGGAVAQPQPAKPGLVDRFKETKAFDRLQDEVSKLGDRFIDQLSTVGQEVVLPALFGKVKELFGVDLSSEKPGQTTGGASARAAAAGASSSSSSASSLADASRGADASRDDYGRSSNAGSVLNNAQ